MEMQKLTDLAAKIGEILPNATWGEDYDGQLVIYTNMHIAAMQVGVEYVADMSEGEESWTQAGWVQNTKAVK